MRTRGIAAVSGVVLAMVFGGQPASASTEPAAQGDYCMQALEGGPAKCFASGQALRAHETAAAVDPLLTVFKDINYTGGYKNYYSAYGRATCDDALTPNEASSGDLTKDHFDTGLTVDRDISSFVIKSYSTCLVTVYDQLGFHGNHDVKGVNCPDMRTCFASGNWNNRVRSLAVT